MDKNPQNKAREIDAHAASLEGTNPSIVIGQQKEILAENGRKMETGPIFGDLKLAQKMQRLELHLVDFEEQFVRGGGKGGQKINKSSNAVWLRHKPTGLDVKVQKFRELWGNRLSAYRLLVDKIEDLRLGKDSSKNKELAKIRKQKNRRKRKTKSKLELETMTKQF